MRRILLLVTVAAMMALMAVVTAAPALAIPPHVHNFTPPGQDESHQIARGTACNANPRALDNFHENVHTNPNHPQSGNITADPVTC